MAGYLSTDPYGGTAITGTPMPTTGATNALGLSAPSFAQALNTSSVRPKGSITGFPSSGFLGLGSSAPTLASLGSAGPSTGLTSTPTPSGGYPSLPGQGPPVPGLLPPSITSSAPTGYYDSTGTWVNYGSEGPGGFSGHLPAQGSPGGLSTAGPTLMAPAQIGEVRMINGQLAQWDGQGWKVG